MLNINHKRDGARTPHAVFIQLDQHQRAATGICQAALIEQGIAKAVQDEGAVCPSTALRSAQGLTPET
ncbi:MAG: hypothetical protein KKC71_02155 [Chloroflexi bacterium]|nr:hypothetical protein [Chloroflexota bacterium]